MGKQENQRAKDRAKKAAVKKALYDRPQEQREKSKYAKRVRARRNGRAMADRSGERKPWWEFGPVPLSVEMARSAARVRRLEDESPRMAKVVAAGVAVLESAA